ncbi:MAG: class I SAM-dependent methyltransferase [Candidatus Aenigmarchaeota archaeon]|nr:class I SAM-dependent methyltransferase [Candidatus Aenigmarchaeota archaeon]
MEQELGQEELRRLTQKEYRKLDIRDDPDYHGYWLAMFSHILGGLNGKRILDIGCGGNYQIFNTYPPRFLRLAKNYGVEAVGFDPTIDPEKEEFEAHKKGVEELPGLFEADSFNGVLTTELWSDPTLTDSGRNLSYVNSLQNQTYAEAVRILKPRGIYINYFTLESMPISREALRKLGFEIVHYYRGITPRENLVVVRKP